MKVFIPVGKPCIDESDIAAVAEVLKSGWLTTGPVVSRFENSLLEYLEKPNLSAVAVNSCTAGLFLALKALGVGPGDEVIVPCVTYVATSHVVGWCGAKLILCDVDPDTRNISIDSLKSKITKNTRVVMPVHVAGYPCDMEEIWELARVHGFEVIEDAAHALGAKENWGKIGTGESIATVYSFYANKNLSCGEGGMLISPNPDFAEKVRKLSYFGIDKRAHQRYSAKGSWYYEVELLGYKFNMDSIHAALGLSQLQKFQKMQDRRQEIARLYSEGLKNVEGLLLPVWHEGHAWHLYQVRVLNGMRDQLVERLTSEGIGTSVHFIPLYRHPFYETEHNKHNFPCSENVFSQTLSIPIYPAISSEELNKVIRVIERVLNG